MKIGPCRRLLGQESPILWTVTALSMTHIAARVYDAPWAIVGTLATLISGLEGLCSSSHHFLCLHCFYSSARSVTISLRPSNYTSLILSLIWGLFPTRPYTYSYIPVLRLLWDFYLVVAARGLGGLS